MPQLAPNLPTTPAAYILQSLAAATAPPLSPRVSRRARRAGLVVSALPTLFLTLDAALKLAQLPMALEGTAQLGYRPAVVLPLGVLQVVCLCLYLTPRTAALGAILWTGYLGGAVATHVRVGSPVLTHMLFPVVLGALLWLGLWLRDRRVRILL